MSKHFVCGQFEDAYYAPKLGNWEAPSHLKPATTIPKTKNTLTYREKPTTKILVNDRGHLVNRDLNSVSSFKPLPHPGSHGATKKRWPATKGHAAVPYAGRATFGFKGEQRRA